MEKTPARRLAEAFGDVTELQKLYADDVVWSLSESLGRIAGPYVGKEEVIAFNERVWGSFYHPDVTVEILDELGDDTLSAVRFIYNARMRNSGGDYSLEYVLFAHGEDGLVTKVFESMDTLGSANLFAGKAVDLNPHRA